MIINVSFFPAMGISTVGRHETEAQEVSTADSSRVKGSVPVRGNFFALIPFWPI